MPKHEKPSRTTFKLNSATLVLKHIDDRSAKIVGLKSEQYRQGHATAIMTEVIQYADARDITLTLDVLRFGDPRQGLDNKGLIRFYEKFGFTVVDTGHPIVMERNPLLKGEER